MTFPAVSSAVEITDSGQSHTMLQGGSFSPEAAMVCRIGDYLYFIYQTDSTHVWCRKFDLEAGTFGSAIQIDTVGYGYPYHGQPSIAPDGGGKLHPLVLRDYTTAGFTNSLKLTTVATRTIPDLGDSGGWSDVDGVPSRFAASSANFPNAVPPLIWDIQVQYDPYDKIAYVLGDGAWFHPMDGRANIGDTRILFRILSDGTFEGPFSITEAVDKCLNATECAAAGVSTSAVTTGYRYTKGCLKLTRNNGITTLHLIWNHRREFRYPGSTDVTHQFNVYYAKSIDRGETWRPIDISCTVNNRDWRGSEPPHIRYDDSRFLAYSGDVQPDSCYAFTLDRNGWPIVALCTPKSTESAKIVLGQMDWTQSPSCDLRQVRWNGSAWVTSTIDASGDYKFFRPVMTKDLNHKLYFIYGSGGNTIRYRSSSDDGATWSASAQLCAASGENYRVHMLEDYVDRNYIHLVWGDTNTSKPYFVTVQLSAVDTPGAESFNPRIAFSRGRPRARRR